VQRHWPQAQLHFVLSREAPYAADCPFPVTLLPSSATFHSREVCALISRLRPDLVLFDNAGRTAQLRAARAARARIVFVSSRGRQRRKAFRLRWMRLIDEHWIAYPEFVAGALGLTERWKLRVLGRPVVRYMDTILPESASAQGSALMERLGLAPQRYVLVVPGGGTPHPGAVDAPRIVAEAAAALAHNGHKTVLVGVDSPLQHPLLIVTPRLAMGELTALLSAAQVVVTNGGDTLLQALACGRPCIACPVAHDQHERIRRCEAAGVALAAPLDASQLAQTALALLADPQALAAQTAGAALHPVRNAIPAAIAAIARLVGPDADGAAAISSAGADA